MAVGLAAVLLSACDPAWKGEGHLIDGTSAPVASAAVTLACPSGHDQHETSDPSGSFSFGGVGSSFEAPKCTVRVDAAGFAKRTVPVFDLCYRNSRAGHTDFTCRAGEGTIVLSRDSSASAASSAAPTKR